MIQQEGSLNSFFLFLFGLSLNSYYLPHQSVSQQVSQTETDDSKLAIQYGRPLISTLS